MRSGVFTILTNWITQYPQDFSENDELYKNVHFWVAETVASTPGEADAEWGTSVVSFQDLLRQLQLSVMTCCIQQVEKKAMKRSSKRVSRANAMQSFSKATGADAGAQSATIDFDAATPQQLVDYLESVARVFFEKIEERDLLMASELFQNRSHDPMAWYIAKNSSSSLASQHPDEMPQVNNMYKMLELIRWPRDGPTLSHRLASTIRDACAAQNLLRGWIAIQIIESQIGLAKRQARIEKLLDAVWICRARMCNGRSEVSSSGGTSPAPLSNVFQEPTIASFVECLIVGSLTSSESRLFTRAWQEVAVNRKGNCDHLYSLRPSQAVAEALREPALKTCTPDIGWILKTIAEIMVKKSLDGAGKVNGSNTAPMDSSALIDFDRFGTIWNFIESSISFHSKIKTNALDPEMVELAGARLTAMQSELRNVTWERRAFKEDAAQEAVSAAPLASVLLGTIMRGTRPLTGVSVLQQEKHRRDRRALEVLEYLQHTKRTQQAAAASASAAAAAAAAISLSAKKTASHQVPVNRSYSSPPTASHIGAAVIAATSTSTSPLAAAASANDKKTRRMTALFRGAVRPMGLMGSSIERLNYGGSNTNNSGSGSTDHSTHSTAELLSLTPTQKPSLVLNCGSSVVNVWSNGQKSFVFHLSVVEGGHVLLQATSQREMAEWCNIIEKTSKSYAVPTTTASLHDGAKGKGGKKGVPAVALYGTKIEALVEYEKRTLPLGLIRMLEEVEARGLREQGIYRISGAKNAIESLKLAFSKQSADSIDLAHGEYSDIHTIAGAIKQWFRELPEPAVPFSFYHRFIEAEGIDSEEERLYAIRDLVWDFPKAHFDLLKRISQHLSLICDEGEYNLMAPHNIGLVFGTSLLNPPPGPSSVAESFGNIGKAAHIVKIVLTMHDWLFEPEPEPEPVVAQDTEVREPGEGVVEQQSSPEMERGTLRKEQVASSTDVARSGSYEGEQQQQQQQQQQQHQHQPDDQAHEELADYGTEIEGASNDDMVLGASSSQNTILGRESEPRKAPIPTLILDSPTTDYSQTLGEKQLRQLQQQQQQQQPSPHQTVNEAGVAMTTSLGVREGQHNDRGDSVYLDATDAIAVLQDPFEEEEDPLDE
jgi:hypothetical protein